MDAVGSVQVSVAVSSVAVSSVAVAWVVVAWVEEDLFDETWKTDQEHGEGIHHLGGNVFSVSKERLVVRV